MVHYACLDSCSDQVGCTIHGKPFCLRDVNETRGDLSIPGTPFNIQLEKSYDTEYQYLNFSWTVPQDGSLYYLEGFMFEIWLYSKYGPYASRCFNLNLEKNWRSVFNSTKQRNLNIYFRCVQLHQNAYERLEVRIYSRPFRYQTSKVWERFVPITPDGRWFPMLDILSNNSDKIHIKLLNPLPEAKTYNFKIMSNSQSFVKLASYTLVNTSAELSEKPFIDIVIPDTFRKEQFTISLEAFGFDGHPVQSTTTYEHSFRLSNNSPSEGGIDDNRLIIILVTISIVIVASVLICILWRVKIWLKLRKWIHIFSRKSSAQNVEIKLPKVFPIYCFESDNYVKVVQCHLSLLQTYVKISRLPSSNYFSCGPCPEDLSWVQSELKSNCVIIYLSPKLGALLHRDIDMSQLHHLDVLCIRSLQALYEVLSKDSSVPLPILVTFDCFEKKEQETVQELHGFLQAHKEIQEQLVPLTLASSCSGVFQLENLDQLLSKLCTISKLSQNKSQNLGCWRESKEAKELQGQLSLVSYFQPEETCAQKCFAVEEPKRGSLTNGSLSYSTKNNRLYSLDTVYLEDLRTPDAQSTDDNEHADEVIDCESELNTCVPLISSSSGFHSGSYQTYDEEMRNLMNPLVGFSKNITGNLHKDSNSHLCSNHPAHHVANECDHPLLNSSADYVDNTLESPPGYCHRPLNGVYSNIPNITPASCSAHHKTHPVQEKFDSLWTMHNGEAFRQLPKIIPPHLCFSSSTSIDSVCERINRINESSTWSDLNLAKP
ncbi:hypothetical protein BgiBS90_017501 [Biomphalaria glabrata]|nr:hypothetical protein BgiBS90_017501 [Biomphalaria glabrata]